MNGNCFKYTLAALSLTALAGSAGAAPATYTIITTGSGAFGGTQFTNAQVTFLVTGDTSTITFVAGIQYQLPVAGSVSVAGLGSGVLTDPIFVGANSNQYAGIGNLNPAGSVAVQDPVFTHYDLTTSIGPISGPGGVTTGFLMNSSAGALTIDTVTQVSFEANVQAVPEPASMAALGFGALTLLKRRRR